MRLISSHVSSTRILSSCTRKCCLSFHSSNAERTAALLASRFDRRQCKLHCQIDGQSYRCIATLSTLHTTCTINMIKNQMSPIRKVHHTSKTAAAERGNEDSPKVSRTFQKSDRNIEDELDQSEFVKVQEFLDVHNVEFSAASNDQSQAKYVFVEGDVRRAGLTHRKRVERKALRKNADTSKAAVVAARIRHKLSGEEKKSELGKHDI